MARNLRIASVVVDLVANSARYVAGLRKANRDTRRYTRSMQRSFNNLSRNIAGLAAGYLGFSAAINQFNKSLANAKEVEIMAQLASQSVEAFQAAAYATNQYGISAEKLGDISKDVQDKLGDFIATGGGEFKDFFEQVAPKVGLTADQLQGLSGPDVLLRVKKAMEDANVPMEQQVFYLEAIANDASKLIPLLKNNGDAYHRLAQEARDANVIMSQADITALRESEKVINRVSTQISRSFARGVAGAAEQIEWLGNYVSKIMVAIGDIMDSWNEETNTLGGTFIQLADLLEEQQKMQAKLASMTKEHGAANIWDALFGGPTYKQAVRNRLKEIETEIARLQEKRHQLQMPVKTPQPVLPELNLPGAGTVGVTAKKNADEIIRENQRLLDSLTRTFATQEQLINQNYLKQVEQIGTLQLTKAQLDKAGYDNLLQLQSDYLIQAEAVREEALNRLKEQTKTANDEQATSFDGLAMAINASTDTMAMAATGWANGFSTELAKMVTQGQMDFGRLAESIINDILRIAIQANITQPLLQGLGLAQAPAPAPAAKALGGPVMRGQTYLVGEKGPELFTASNSGNITPNHKLGGNTQVNIYTQPGETAETRTRQTENGDIVEVFMKQVDSRMNEQISRGQGLARTLEGRYALSRKSY
ncbi:phage tail tape measure C-terminal domain-containing protein [Endozoicomonas sp. YOMI1]|uniref:phage tail tape measure C-terminal domain-containing protein n=1 Tax=Endozoicomonas sp. YOMI1 TaxID=2828739 RepID=UPI0021477475|nr:phage tail tape measure C-terminal domain-containing protein [Endozoicomonas sp. YOMI1]